MSDLPHLAATKCPCDHKSCRSGNLSPITFAQGVMSFDEAQELAHRANAFPELLAALREANEALCDALNNLPRGGECATFIRARLANLSLKFTEANTRLARAQVSS